MSYNTNTTPVRQKILASLKKPGATLTKNQALSRWGIFNLSARISELRQEGYDIVCEKITNKKGEVSYRYKLNEKVTKTTKSVKASTKSCFPFPTKF